MLGFPDHTTNPNTGRPEPHRSWWFGEVLNLTLWATAAIALIGAGLTYFYSGDLGTSRATVVPAVIFASLGLVLNLILRRNKRAYRQALTAWEEGMQRAFDDTNSP